MQNLFLSSLPMLTAQAETQPANPLVSLFPIILIFVIMYMLLIRPQQKKNKEHQEMVKRLKAGDQVVTAGGIHGRITGVKDKSVTVRIADQVEIEVSRMSVAAVQKETGDNESKTK